MNAGDLATSAACLNDAWKVFERQRAATRALWNDARARQFEKERLDPLEPKFLRLIESIARLSQVFSAARHECQCRDDVAL